MTRTATAQAAPVVQWDELRGNQTSPRRRFHGARFHALGTVTAAGKTYRCEVIEGLGKPTLEDVILRSLSEAALGNLIPSPKLDNLRQAVLAAYLEIRERDRATARAGAMANEAVNVESVFLVSRRTEDGRAWLISADGCGWVSDRGGAHAFGDLAQADAAARLHKGMVSCWTREDFDAARAALDAEMEADHLATAAGPGVETFNRLRWDEGKEFPEALKEAARSVGCAASTLFEALRREAPFGEDSNPQSCTVTVRQGGAELATVPAEDWPLSSAGIERLAYHVLGDFKRGLDPADGSTYSRTWGVGGQTFATIWIDGASPLEMVINGRRSEGVWRRDFAYFPHNCPSKHWNDGNDICADCGEDLQGGPPAELDAPTLAAGLAEAMGGPLAVDSEIERIRDGLAFEGENFRIGPPPVTCAHGVLLTLNCANCAAPGFRVFTFDDGDTEPQPLGVVGPEGLDSVIGAAVGEFAEPLHTITAYRSDGSEIEAFAGIDLDRAEEERAAMFYRLKECSAVRILQTSGEGVGTIYDQPRGAGWGEGFAMPAAPVRRAVFIGSIQVFTAATEEAAQAWLEGHKGQYEDVRALGWHDWAPLALGVPYCDRVPPGAPPPDALSVAAINRLSSLRLKAATLASKSADWSADATQEVPRGVLVIRALARSGSPYEYRLTHNGQDVTTAAALRHLDAAHEAGYF